MTNIRTFIIPDGVFGYLNILPNTLVEIFDHWRWSWQNAPLMQMKHPTISVPQCALACDDLAAKEWIFSLIDNHHHYALLVRPNNHFGLVRSAQEFIAPEQMFVK